MPLIIPIFIKNRGCPHRCIFCNEKMIAGDQPDDITEISVREIAGRYLSGPSKRDGETQIAFYGGNFTGLDQQEQARLLEMTRPFLESGQVQSLRISTRPDAIDANVLDLLSAYHVRTVEIGVQSMNDEVLRLSERGHTARDVIRAVRLLKERGMEAGIHLMAGLPGDSEERFAETVEAVAALQPATVRIHPAIVFKGTGLAHMIAAGRYRPLSLEEAVLYCKPAVRRFAAAGIPVVRLGLQTTKEMESPGNIVAGPFHPAFGALVYESIFYDMAASLLSRRRHPDGAFVFLVSPGDISHLRGHGQRNLNSLKNAFGLAEIVIIPDKGLKRGMLAIRETPDAPPLCTSLSSPV
jgi:histone acetyltransferase (RNA polymerase elongator complex component)